MNGDINNRTFSCKSVRDKTVHSARQIGKTLKAAEFSDHSQIDA